MLALVLDPMAPSTLYAATWDGGVFRSTDAGESWRGFGQGLTTGPVETLAIDSTGRTLYAGTGVFDYWFPG